MQLLNGLFFALNQLYGFAVADDPEAVTGKAAEFSRARVTIENEFLEATPTRRDAPGARGISICIEQDTKVVCGVALFLEDIVPEHFHLYYIGSVSGISGSADTRVDLFGNNFEWVSLSGISTLFPMDACDVYLSMKFSGEVYGGEKGSTQRILLDYALVVRKSKSRLPL